jgi:peptide-methionine (R)-S-oxide reductase
MAKLQRSEAEWRKLLSPEQYEVLRKKGTERAFSGALYKNTADGTYLCAGCGQELFGSAAKFESGTGWPSFYEPVRSDQVETQRDFSWGMIRTEVHCSNCGSHLGHVFPDGPQPTGLRYCINSLSLQFKPGS